MSFKSNVCAKCNQQTILNYTVGNPALCCITYQFTDSHFYGVMKVVRWDDTHKHMSNSCWSSSSLSACVFLEAWKGTL